MRRRRLPSLRSEAPLLLLATRNCPLAASGCPMTATTECGRCEGRSSTTSLPDPVGRGRPTTPRPRSDRRRARCVRIRHLLRPLQAGIWPAKRRSPRLMALGTRGSVWLIGMPTDRQTVEAARSCLKPRARSPWPSGTSDHDARPARVGGPGPSLAGWLGFDGSCNRSVTAPQRRFSTIASNRSPELTTAERRSTNGARRPPRPRTWPAARALPA